MAFSLTYAPGNDFRINLDGFSVKVYERPKRTIPMAEAQEVVETWDDLLEVMAELVDEPAAVNRMLKLEQSADVFVVYVDDWEYRLLRLNGGDIEAPAIVTKELAVRDFRQLVMWIKGWL